MLSKTFWGDLRTTFSDRGSSVLREGREQPPCPCSYSNHRRQLFWSCQRYSGIILKGSYPETSLTRRRNPPQSAYSEARPICVWIKDVRRRRCVLSRAMLPCRLSRLIGERRHEWKRCCTFPASNVWNGKWAEPPTMGAKKREQLCFFFFLSRSPTRQHDYSTAAERENSRRHRCKMKPDRRHSAAFLTRAHYRRPCSFLCAAPPLLRLSLRVISSLHLHLSLQFPRSSSLLI